MYSLYPSKNVNIIVDDIKGIIQEKGIIKAPFNCIIKSKNNKNNGITIVPIDEIIVPTNEVVVPSDLLITFTNIDKENFDLLKVNFIYNQWDNIFTNANDTKIVCTYKKEIINITKCFYINKDLSLETSVKKLHFKYLKKYIYETGVYLISSASFIYKNPSFIKGKCMAENCQEFSDIMVSKLFTDYAMLKTNSRVKVIEIIKNNNHSVWGKIGKDKYFCIKDYDGTLSANYFE